MADIKEKAKVVITESESEDIRFSKGKTYFYPEFVEMMKKRSHELDGGQKESVSFNITLSGHSMYYQAEMSKEAEPFPIAERIAVSNTKEGDKSERQAFLDELESERFGALKIQTGYFGALKSEGYQNPVSISRSVPKGIKGTIPELSNLAPSWDTLKDYKDQKIDKEGYTKRFAQDLLSSSYGKNYEGEEREKVARARALEDIKELAGESDTLTLLCWERQGDFCHRYLIGEWLSGKDFKTIEQELPEMEMTDKERFSVYRSGDQEKGVEQKMEEEKMESKIKDIFKTIDEGELRDIKELANLVEAENKATDERRYNMREHKKRPTSYVKSPFIKNSKDPIATLFASNIDTSALFRDEKEALGLDGREMKIAESKEFMNLARLFAKDILKLRAPIFEKSKDGMRKTNTLIVGGPVAELASNEGEELEAKESYDLSNITSSLAMTKDVLENIFLVKTNFNTKDDMRSMEEKNLTDLAMDSEDIGSNVDIQDDVAYVSKGYKNKSAHVYAPSYILDNISDDGFFDLGIYTSFEKSLDLPTSYRDSELGVKSGELEFPIHAQSVHNTFDVAYSLSSLCRAYEKMEKERNYDNADTFDIESKNIISQYFKDTNESFFDGKLSGRMIISYLKSTGLYDSLLEQPRLERDEGMMYYCQAFDMKKSISQMRYYEHMDKNEFQEQYKITHEMIEDSEKRVPFKDFFSFVCPDMDVEDHVRMQSSGLSGSLYIPQSVALSDDAIFDDVIESIANGKKGELEPLCAVPTYLKLGRNSSVISYCPIYSSYDMKALDSAVSKYANNAQKAMFYNNIVKKNDVDFKKVIESCKNPQKIAENFKEQLSHISAKEMDTFLDNYGVKKLLLSTSAEESGRLDENLIKSAVAPIIREEKKAEYEKSRREKKVAPKTIGARTPER